MPAPRRSCLASGLLICLALVLSGCGEEPAAPAKPEGEAAQSEAPAPESGDKGAKTAEPGAEAPAATATDSGAAPAPQGGESRVIIELKTGKVVIELRPDLAPKHVERIRKLTKEGFYNGIAFHRVIDGFMAQTGDPTGTGAGGSEYGTIKAEFTSTPFERGTVGAARTRDPDTADSQFFICFDDNGCKPLTGSYTVWGRVVSGMEHVDQIKRGDPRGGGMVTDPDRIVKMYLE